MAPDHPVTRKLATFMLPHRLKREMLSLIGGRGRSTKGRGANFTGGKRGSEDKWPKRYTAGPMLLDLREPWKMIGGYDQPLLSPETGAERSGFRDDVLFPGGMILEPSGEVKIYYGAADTVECLSTAQLDDLLAQCKPV